MANISYDVFECVSATSCTTDSEHEDREGCQPQSLREHKTWAIINIGLIIIIGGLGNLFTIISICVCRIRHKLKYKHLWNSTTVLMLNLSVCDFLYCVLGLPTFISTYYHGFLPHSESFCWYSAMIRNWLAYTGFLTMAAIAVNRSLGCLLFRCDQEQVARSVLRPRLTGLVCVSLWLVAFAILSPITFTMTIGSYYFGTFGYDVKHGKCEAISCKDKEGFSPGGFIFSIAFFVPFLFILFSYLFISILLELEKRKKRRLLKNQSQVPVGRIQIALTSLTASMVLFTLPVLVVENITVEDEDLVHLIVYSWYQWLYAINFVLYVLTLSDFRKLFLQILNDIGFGVRTIQTVENEDSSIVTMKERRSLPSQESRLSSN